MAAILLFLVLIVAMVSFPRPSNFTIFGQQRELRVRLVVHGTPSYDAWLAANGPFFLPGAPAAYPPDAHMYAHRELFFVSPDKQQMFYILFFEPKGEAAIRAAFGPDSPAWDAGEKAGFLLKPVAVKHMDAESLFSGGGEPVLPKPGHAFVQPDSWPQSFPSIDQSTLVFDCPVHVKTGKYECVEG